MAWRPTKYLIEGELNNTTPNMILGWMKFLGMSQRVIIGLKGDFHRDIRGAKIRISNDEYKNESLEEARKYFKGFDHKQFGEAGDITRGIGEGADYTLYGYIEYYSKENGRVVIELEPDQIEILTKPIPASESDPIDRNKQNKLFHKFLKDISKGLE